MQENLLAVLGEQLRREFEGVITTHATDWLAPITSGTFFLPALEVDTAELLQTIDAWMSLVEWLTSGFFPEGLVGWETAVSPSTPPSDLLPNFESLTHPTAPVDTPPPSALATPLAHQRRVLAPPPKHVARVGAPSISDTPTLHSNLATRITEPMTSQMGSILPFQTETHRLDAPPATISSLESSLKETSPELGQPKRPGTFSPTPKQPHTLAGVSVNDESMMAQTTALFVNKPPLESAAPASYPATVPFGVSNQPTLTENPNDKITQSQKVGGNLLTANTTSPARWSTTTGESDGIVFGGQLNQPATRPVTGNSDKVSQSRMGAVLEQPITEPVVGNLTQSQQPVVANKPHTPMANVEWEINDDITSNLWRPEQPVVTVTHEGTPAANSALLESAAKNVVKNQPGVKGLRDFAAFLQTAVSPSSAPNSATQFVPEQPPAPTEQPVREVAPGQKPFSSAPPQPQVVRSSLQTNPSATSRNPLKAAQPNSLTHTAVWGDSNIAGTLSSNELAQFEQITNPFGDLQDTLHSNSAQTQEEQDMFTWAGELTQPLSRQYPVEMEGSGNQRSIPPTHRQMKTAVKKSTDSSSGLERRQPIPQPMLTEEWEKLIQEGEAGLLESLSSIQAAPPQPQVVRSSLQTNPSATSRNPLKAAQPNSLTHTAVWDDSNIAGTLSSDELAQFEQITNPFGDLQDTLHSNSAQTQEEQDMFTWAEELTQLLSRQYPVEMEGSGNQRSIPHPLSSGLADWQPIPQPVLTEEWKELIRRDEAGLFESPSSTQTDQPGENVAIHHSPPPVKGLRELANLVQDSFAGWQNINTAATANPIESFVTSQTTFTHQELSRRKGRKAKRKSLRPLQLNPSGLEQLPKEMVAPEFPSSPTIAEEVMPHPAPTAETINSMPLAAISEPDIDLILEALAQEIQREYKRFYG